MWFDRVYAVVTDPDRAPTALAVTAALVRPGALVSVVVAPSAPDTATDDTALARAVEALEGLVAAWSRELADVTVAVTEGPLGPEVRAAELTVVEPGTSLERRYELLSLDRPVLLAEQPLDGTHLGFVVWGPPSGSRGLAHVARRAPPDAHLHVFQVRRDDAMEVAVIREVLGIAGTVEVSEVPWSLTGPLLPLREEVQASSVDLVALPVPRGPRGWATLGLAPLLGTAVLLVPDVAADGAPVAPLALFDALEVGDEHRTLAVRIDALGGVSGLDSETPVTVVSGGTTVGVASAERGRIRTKAHPVTAWGLSTGADEDEAPDAVARVARAEGDDVALVWHTTPRARVRELRDAGLRVWALASDWVDPRRIRQHTGATRVLHIATVVDTPVLADVPEAAHEALLLRAARHLTLLGVPVRRVGRDPFEPGPLPVDGDLTTTLEALCDARPTTLDDLRWHTDNAVARTRMLGLLDAARDELLFQVYMFEEDPVGAEVAEALGRAAGRGVRVRVLVDALWSRHEALGQENALLTSLAAVEGVALRVAKPVEGLRDLKQRDHRKVVVVDGRAALLAGRNVASHYLTDFSEHALTPHTDQRLVPWLDLSSEVTGAVVGELRRGFEQAWEESGGEDLPASPPPTSPGAQDVWVVQHRGLRDVNTLEALRLLIASATSQITLVNTFPLQFELRGVLEAALRRGVAVRIYTGHVRPRFDGGARAFPGGAGRDLATELVHGRWDPLVSAGAQVYAMGVPPDPSWDPEVGVVLPHVHGKWLSVDHAWFMAGSANVDTSSTYWEDEVVLIGRDPARVAEVERWLDGFVPTSLLFDADDAAWKHRAQRRAWMAENWPALLS